MREMGKGWHAVLIGTTAQIDSRSGLRTLRESITLPSVKERNSGTP